MSRHGGSSVGRGLPLFQIEVLDYASRDARYTKTVLMDNGYGREKVDILSEIPCRTLVGRFKNYKRALRWGQRFGTVKECHKVDTSPYLNNINYLNLDQKPITIEVDLEEFTVNESLEVTRGIEDREFDVEIG
jgi:hypothetical protein